MSTLELDHSGAEAAPAMPAARSRIRVAVLRENHIERGDAELIGGWSEESDDCIWIDVTAPTQTDIEPLLEEWFRFHELAAEDALSPTTLPKHDSFPRYDFFVFRSIGFDAEKHGIDSEKLSCFLGRNFLFTIHRNPLEAVNHVWDRLPQDIRLMQRGVDFTLYSVLDFLVDQHFPLLDDIEDRMDEIHELIFTSPTQSLLDELLDMKRDLNVLRRQSLPQRDLFSQLSRGTGQFIRQEHQIYFRDLYDHMYRIGESIDVERDLATGTMEAYLSVIANRTNDIMKVLTIFSSIMLPINFIASIYGMNFEHMPELHWKFGYLWAVTMMSVVAIFMLTWFWTKGWIFPSTSSFLRRGRRREGQSRRRSRRKKLPR